jgi:hypothetical protein
MAMIKISTTMSFFLAVYFFELKTYNNESKFIDMFDYYRFTSARWDIIHYSVVKNFFITSK